MYFFEGLGAALAECAWLGLMKGGKRTRPKTLKPALGGGF